MDVIGFTLQETAELVGAPLGTVKSRRNRARARLVRSAAQDALLLQSA
ncbi:MAG: sigma factor-like helix-turn-helix DNA-binding protein [Lawsonella clevelandensis]